jgi:A/G-specific adenine glycosylase
LIETAKEEEFDLLPNRLNGLLFWQRVLSVMACNEKSIIHKLSHQHLYIKFWKVSVRGAVENGISNEVFENFSIPIVIHNF